MASQEGSRPLEIDSATLEAFARMQAMDHVSPEIPFFSHNMGNGSRLAQLRQESQERHLQEKMQELLPHARARLEVMGEVERGAAIERAQSLAQIPFVASAVLPPSTALSEGGNLWIESEMAAIATNHPSGQDPTISSPSKGQRRGALKRKAEAVEALKASILPAPRLIPRSVMPTFSYPSFASRPGGSSIQSKPPTLTADPPFEGPFLPLYPASQPIDPHYHKITQRGMDPRGSRVERADDTPLPRPTLNAMGNGNGPLHIPFASKPSNLSPLPLEQSPARRWDGNNRERSNERYPIPHRRHYGEKEIREVTLREATAKVQSVHDSILRAQSQFIARIREEEDSLHRQPPMKSADYRDSLASLDFEGRMLARRVGHSFEEHVTKVTDMASNAVRKMHRHVDASIIQGRISGLQEGERLFLEAIQEVQRRHN